jgi:lipopolysaccharide transport system ATP-binding protein
MKPIIEVRNLSKKYKIGERQRYLSLRDSVSNIFSRKNREESEFWALDDVSFDIQAGESIGIIGRNGAGKSTLLKILSRITPPTKGSVILRGRMASLLEVGTGFHSELTGRENVFMNGSILGLKKREIEAKFDEIVDFSGVEQFIDTPLKHYSSGMQLRLAFAVAAHLEPEILVIDEVLAVGDAEFQKRCLGKMDEVSKSGRTVIFVSHNLETVLKLCSKTILLTLGKLEYVGFTSECIHNYLQLKSSQDKIYYSEPGIKPSITKIEVKTSLSNQVHEFGKPLEIEFEIYTPIPIVGACFSFQITDIQERPIVHLWTFDNERPMCRKEGKHRIICKIDTPKLYMGEYFINTYLSESYGGVVFEILKSVVPFEVKMYGMSREFPWVPFTCTYIEDCVWYV